MINKLSYRPKFVCYARLDLIHAFPEMIDLMYAIGVRAIVFGIETLDKKAGAAIGKGLGKDRIQSTLERIKDKYPDLLLASGFIVGLPYDSLEQQEQTLDWLMSYKLLDSWIFYTLKIDNLTSDPFRSEFSKNVERFGYKRIGAYQWENSNFDYKAADQVTNKLNLKSFSQSGLFPWTIFGLLKFANFETVRTLKRNQLHSFLIDKHVNSFDQYKKLIFKDSEVT